MSDIFKKKILHRSKYRGIKELDIIFDRFVEKYNSSLSNEELKQLEELLNLPDNELLDILLKKAEIPSNLKNQVLQKILKCCDVK
jgi:antitoxin CptB